MINKKLGTCPFCDDGHIEVRNIKVNAKPIKLYACTKAHWIFEHDIYELSEESTCSYRIFSNQFLAWNKKSIGENEIRKVLDEKQVKVRLFSSGTKT